MATKEEPTWTAEDQKALEDLQAKQAKNQQAQVDKENAARLESLKPVAEVLTTDGVNTQLTGLRTARQKVTDVDVAVRLDRIIQILSGDALALTQMIDNLKATGTTTA